MASDLESPGGVHSASSRVPVRRRNGRQSLVRDSQSAPRRECSRVFRRSHPSHRVGTDSKRLVFANAYCYGDSSASGIIHSPCVRNLLEASWLDSNLVLRLGRFRWRSFQRGKLRHLRSRVQLLYHGNWIPAYGDLLLHRPLHSTGAANIH